MLPGSEKSDTAEGGEQICQSEGWREEKDEKRELNSGVGECGFYECKEWGNSGYAAEK